MIDVCIDDTSLKGLLFPIDFKYRKKQEISEFGEFIDTLDADNQETYFERISEKYKEYKP